MVVRLLFKLFRSTPIYASKKQFALNVIASLVSVGIWRWFSLIGTPRRDNKGNIKSGENLRGGGVIDLAWDLSVSLNTHYGDSDNEPKMVGADMSLGYMSLGSV